MMHQADGGNMGFAADLRERMESRGFTAPGLARSLECAPQTVYAWLAGRKLPSTGLANALRLTLPGLLVPSVERRGRPRLGFNVALTIHVSEQQDGALRALSRKAGRPVTCLVREAIVDLLAAQEG
jgi:hypothetical protein